MIYHLKTVVFFCFFSLMSIQLVAQTGTITGTVFDSTKNILFSGVNVSIKGTNQGSATDKNGVFTITNVAVGTYTLSMSHTGYNTIEVANVIVTENATTTINQTSMTIFVKKIGTGKIVAKRKTNTEKAVIQEVKKAETVVNGVSSEELNKTQATDAAKAAARIPGVTLMENRFIMLRGLSQRYNSVQINNINAPSTEVDKRAFSFDLVPSSMLDKILIYKSGAAELAGDFAGGVIKLYTKSNVEKDFLTVNLGFGIRLNTTFLSHQNNNVSSGSDLWGYDNGGRALPSSFPNTLAGLSNQSAMSYGRNLKNNYQVNSTVAPMDFGAGISFGKNIKLGKKMSLFTVNNISYSTNYQYSNINRYRYQNDQIDYVRQMFNYTDENYSIESKISALSNWLLTLNKNNTISVKNMYNQIGENETTIRKGVNPTERPNTEFKNYGFHYTSRSIYFGQLEGIHKLNTMGDKLTWTGGYSSVKRNEPDYRRFRTYRTEGSDDPYTMIDPPSSSLFDAARFYSDLNEHTVSGTINYEKNFNNPFDSTKNIIIRAGAYAEEKSREFTARWFGYVYQGSGVIKDAFLQQPIDQIFKSDNINTKSGWRPAEGTNPNDKYTATNQLKAGYIGATIPMNRFSVSLGMRAEQFAQNLKSATQSSSVNVTLDSLNILPSINMSYYLNDKSLIRLAYSKTINRPEFRELAPFVYYDFVYDVNIVGNPNLKSAVIDNLDFRYEVYPSSDETVSFGLFYKNFTNPIENYVQPIGLSQQYTLKNAKQATNFGLEVELRKSLDNMTQNKFLKNLSVVMNASLIYSQVNLGDDSTLSQARTRALQGQSPYIVNAALFYNNEKKGLTANLSYNIFGKRIAYVGNTIFPTVYEMPRQAIDLTFGKEINKRLNFKFGVSDILNFKHRLWQDTNGDGKIQYHTDRTDHELLSFRRGQMLSFSFSYKIK